MTTSIDLGTLKHVRFVAQEFEWSEAMKESVWQKILEPLDRVLKTPEYDLSIHWERDPKHEGHFVLSLILQTFDGQKNRVVRAHGSDFLALVHDVSSHLRSGLRKPTAPRFLSWFGLRSKASRPSNRLN